MTENASKVDPKIIERIKKLSETKGRTEAEMQAFAAKVKELLDQYRLSMTDIEFDTFKKAEPIEEYRLNWEEHGIRTRQARIAWIEYLAGYVATAYFCGILVRQRSSTITFVGRKSDASVAAFVLVTLVRSAEKIADGEHHRVYWECHARGQVEEARGFRKSFLLGFATGIGIRLRAKAQEQTSSTALVRLNTNDVELYVKERYKTAPEKDQQRVKHSLGFQEGYKAAKSLNIDDRPIGQGSSSHDRQLR